MRLGQRLVGSFALSAVGVTAAGLPTDLVTMLAAAPTCTRQVRAALAEWLTAAHWPHDDADDIVLAANEAVANVVDHAYPPQRRGNVQIHAWITTKPEAMTRRVTVAVTDRGSWAQGHRTIDPDGRRGHGLAVMSGCTAELHIQRSAGGTTVVLVSHDVPQHPA